MVACEPRKRLQERVRGEQNTFTNSGDVRAAQARATNSGDGGAAQALKERDMAPQRHVDDENALLSGYLTNACKRCLYKRRLVLSQGSTP